MKRSSTWVTSNDCSPLKASQRYLKYDPQITQTHADEMRDIFYEISPSGDSWIRP
jgi:hypothetical protein